MSPNQIPKSEFEELQKYVQVYKKIDLTYIEEDLDSVQYYISKYKDYPYRTLCSFDKHIQFLSDEGIDRICGIFGYPFTDSITIDEKLLNKCVDVELWFDYDIVKKNPEKLFKELRRLTLQCHANGTRVRAVTELKEIGLQRTNQWLDVCKSAGVDSIQTGYGLTSLNQEWLPEMSIKLEGEFKIKAVGEINSLDEAKKLLGLGADIIGSSTI